MMLTSGFFTVTASLFRGQTDLPGNLFIAVGAGEVSWDETAPTPGRETTTLVAEMARKTVEEIVYLDPAGQVTDNPTPHLRLRTNFLADEAVGTLRECGLFGGVATENPNTGTLLTYYIHPRLQKTEGMTLERVIHINLTPLPYAPGARVTRYLGNSSTRELHDLEQVTNQCQVEEIRPDNRFYHASTEAAQEMGYDFCAYCFGRDLSEN